MDPLSVGFRVQWCSSTRQSLQRLCSPVQAHRAGRWQWSEGGGACWSRGLVRPAGGAQQSGLRARTERQPGRGAGGAACGEIRNNRGGVTGFALEFAIQATVVRNTVYSTQAPYSAAEYRCSWRSGITANNSVSHNVRDLCAWGDPDEREPWRGSSRLVCGRGRCGSTPGNN